MAASWRRRRGPGEAMRAIRTHGGFFVGFWGASDESFGTSGAFGAAILTSQTYGVGEGHIFPVER